MATLRLTVQDLHSHYAADIEVSASPDDSVRALIDSIPVAANGRDAFVGATVLDPQARLADSPLLHGAVISIGGVGPDYRPAQPGAAGAAAGGAAGGTIRVIAGPDAGFGVPLPPGRYLIGRGTAADVCLHDPDVSRSHATIEVSPDGRAVIRDLGSRYGTFVNGEQRTGSVPLDDGSVAGLGKDELSWEPAGTQALPTARTADGRLEFDRGFAEVPVISTEDVPLPPPEAARRGIIAMAVSPVIGVVVGIALFLTTRSALSLMVSVAGVLSPFVIYAVESRRRRTDKLALDQDREAARDKVSRLAADEDLERQLLAPGPAEIVQLATGARRGLWPRDADSPHGLALRVGVTDQDPAFRLRGTPWEGFEIPRLRGVPVTVNLRQTGVLGVIGSGEPARALLRWLVVQLATLRSPDDLQLVVLTAGDGDEVGWMRWLPQLDGAARSVPCLIGNTDGSRADRIKELKQLISAREAERGGAPGTRPGGDVVVVLDRALELRPLPGIRDILRFGPEVGVFALCADSEAMNECRGVCRLTGDGLRLNRSPNESVVTAAPEGIDAVTAERVARALAPMRDRTSATAGAAALPRSVRLLDLLEIGVPTPDDVLNRWHRKRPGPQTEVIIGADANGPVTVDLADVRQGPHAMLGGATGAGKSKLLEALVTSLLLANRPDELNFIVFDFKGGGAFLPFKDCPHVTELITSTGETADDTFDETDAARVLDSVSAEVGRREAILAPYGADIDKYWSVRESQPDLPPLPRVVMIFDEYARVLEISRDFLKELVKVGAKGRSLGMHLVLAAQSLQNKLGPELKNNITLRISLRQTERADSTEVLGVPDAATIPASLYGRGMILRMGEEVKVPRLFQCGYLGDPPPGTGVSNLAVRPLDLASLGTPRPAARPVAGPATDQALAIAAVTEAATRAGLTAPHRALLPKLPALVPLGQLPRLQTEEPPAGAVPFGLADMPKRQAQPPYYLDLAGTGRLLVAGGPQSGRTTFARTLITSLANRLRPDEVHLYVVEHNPAGLQQYAALPHCGGVFSPGEPDRIRRMVEWLAAETERRSTARLSASGAANPVIVLVIDGWEQFETRANPELINSTLGPTLRTIIRTGAPLGVHIVVIGGQELGTGKVADLCDQRLMLPFPNEGTRRLALHGMKPPAVLPGRAIDAGSGYHVQVCLPGVGADELVARMAASYDRAGLAAERLPRAFPALPSTVGVEELPRAPLAPPSWIPLGVGGPETSTIGVGLFDADPHLMLISGPPGSGRSTAIATLARLLSRNGIGVLALAPTSSALAKRLAGDDGIRVITASSIEDSDLRAAAAAFGGNRYAVLLDDADRLTVHPARQGLRDADTLLEEIARPAAFGQRALIIAADAAPILSGTRRSLEKPTREALNSGTRLLLAPAKRDARLLNMALEPDQYFAGPPGRGYLASAGAPTLIQLAIFPAPGL